MSDPSPQPDPAAPAPPPPHPLDLYRLAVQHPLAEVAFIEKVWAQYRGNDTEPQLLREDFAGTAAVAAAWAQSDPERKAFAIELDPVTATWAQDTWHELETELEISIADVLEMYTAVADVVVALNFSVLIYHTEADLLAYLRHARAMLNDRGLLILDLFGGPAPGSDGPGSATTPTFQTRHVDPDEGAFDPFDYTWEQRSYDPDTEKIDCHIHFTLADGTELRDQFTYDWRLWKPQAVMRLAVEAGFATAELWAYGDQPGRMAPVDREPDAEDWVGYVVCAV